jgi:hypothetical protein
MIVDEEVNEADLSAEAEAVEAFDATRSLTHEELVQRILKVARTEKKEREEEEASSSSDEDEDDEDEDEDELTGENGTMHAMVIAQGIKAKFARERLRKEISNRPKDWKPPKSHEKFLRELKKRVYKSWKTDMPSLQRDCDEQRERERVLERRSERYREQGKMQLIHKRGDLLQPLPNSGKSIERKKEGQKMKKSDPNAQGGVFERRKMQEEGAGLFVAPMQPEKVNREVGKLQRKTAGKGWFDLPAAEYTPELKRDLRTLKLRGAYDPKRFYKNADTTKLPTHFQIGTVVEGAQDFHSSRLTKKERGRSFAEEIQKDSQIKKARTGRFVKVQEMKRGSSGTKSKNTNLKKKKK